MIALDNTAKIDLLRMMLRIRKAELQFATMMRAGKIPSGGHLYEGEEAIAAGVCAALTKDDYVTSTHRGHGHYIAKGLDLKRIIAEVCGKKTGYCGGKGGTMHIFDTETGLMGGNGIVGGGLTIAAGIGLSIQLRRTNQVAVAFFGDGASNNGAFHESMNLASLWKLPVIFVCENNQYATSVCVRRSTSVEDISARAVGYDMPGLKIDGNHVDEVYSAATEAADRARSGEGPTLIECKTYRIRGHFEGDDALYRSREEVDEARKNDPIDYWRRVLIAEGVIDEAGVESMGQEVDEEVREAAEYAETSPFPAPEDAFVLSGDRV